MSRACSSSINFRDKYVPIDGNRLPIDASGDFGESPFFRSSQTSNPLNYAKTLRCLLALANPM